MSQNANLQIKVENTGINATKEELEKLTKAGSDAERATDGLNKTVKSMPAAGQPANDSMKKMRHIAGGLGYQLQDVAVQAQSGTSAFVILGQQGSQIASVFGPGGIVAGAIIAIGAALVGTALKATDTSGKLKDIEDDALTLGQAFTISSNGTLDFNERLQRLADTAPTVAAALRKVRIEQVQLEQTLTEGSIKDSLEEFSDIIAIVNVALPETATAFMRFERETKQNTAIKELNEDFGGTKDQILAVASAISEYNQKGNKSTAVNLLNSLSALEGGSVSAKSEVNQLVLMLSKYVETAELLSKSDEPIKEQNKSVLSLIDSLRLEAETLSMTNRERDLYIAKLGEAGQSQLAAINEAYDEIEADRSRTAIEKLESQMLDEEARIDESYMRRREIIMANTIEGSDQQNELINENWAKYEADYGSFQDRLIAADEAAANKKEQIEARVSKSIIRQKEGVVNSGIALLKNLTAGNEKAAKAIVVVEAGLNIARTIQNTAAAQVRALAELGPIAGPPAAATIGAYGAVQVGIIAANGVLQLSGGSSSVSSPSISGSSQSTQSPAFVEPQDTRPGLTININGNLTNVDGEFLVKTIEEHVKATDHVFATFI